MYSQHKKCSEPGRVSLHETAPGFISAILHDDRHTADVLEYWSDSLFHNVMTICAACLPDSGTVDNLLHCYVMKEGILCLEYRF